jgi:hypothetical protein
MWGFTVDDALIPLRYAHHLAEGIGYRFNAHGPATDGVTPLPWAFILAPLATGDLGLALLKAKLLGVIAWTLAGAALGHRLSKGPSRHVYGRILSLSVVALAFPIGAWAASGMETGLALALATLSVVSMNRPMRAALLAGLTAVFRPELVVWGLIIACGAAVAHRRNPRSLISAAALAIAPFAACALVRLAVFGRPAPLALMAKPSDLSHGLVYAGAATVVVLTPLLALPSRALLRTSPVAKTIALAFFAHVAVVALVGGDWMPYARLLVPVAPSLALVFAEVSALAPRTSPARGVACLTFGILIAIRAAPAGRHVHEDRKDLIRLARPELRDAKVIAALDVGWVGAATDAEIVDLAGLTDPSIAALPGGHTSKAVDTAMLLDRNVDTVVVFTSRTRAVEDRLVRSPLFQERYEHAATVGRDALRYALYRRRHSAS